MDFKKLEIRNEILSKVIGGQSDDPCCSITIFADNSPARDDDEDCQESVAGGGFGISSK